MDLNKKLDPISSKCPPEIASYIFSFLSPVSFFPDHVSGETVSLSSLQMKESIRVAHICRAWRAVALSTPQLWSSLKLRDIEPLPRCISMFDAHVARSRTLPLNVDLEFYAEPSTDLLDKLVTHAHRICSLTIDVPSAFTRLLAFTLPTVTTLTVGVNDHTGDTPLDHPQIALIASPVRLKIVDLCIFKLSLDLARLTHVHLDPIRPSELVRLLNDAPALLNCKVHIAAEEHSGGYPIVTHKRLTQLYAVMKPPCTVFLFINLPALRVLIHHSKEGTPCGFIPGCVHRSSSPLGELGLWASPHFSPVITPYLFIKTVVEFRLDAAHPMDVSAVLQFLAIEQTESLARFLGRIHKFFVTIHEPSVWVLGPRKCTVTLFTNLIALLQERMTGCKSILFETYHPESGLRITDMSLARQLLALQAAGTFITINEESITRHIPDYITSAVESQQDDDEFILW